MQKKPKTGYPTTNDVRIATLMANRVYDLPTTYLMERQEFLDGRSLSWTSFPLSRNIIGTTGNINVAFFVQGTTLFIAYEGTQELEFWLYNADTRLEVFSGFSFHEGFYQLARVVRKKLKQWSSVINGTVIEKIIHCGHSAGGATAGIIPLLTNEYHHIPQLVIDFGAPRYRADDKEYPFFRLRFQEIYDLVPCLPLTWRGPLPGFNHYGVRLFVDPTGTITPLRPWHCPAMFVWKYLKNLIRAEVTDKIAYHHAMDNYSKAVLNGYPQDLI